MLQLSLTKMKARNTRKLKSLDANMSYINTYIYVYVEKLSLYILHGMKILAKKKVLQCELCFIMVFFSSGK